MPDNQHRKLYSKTNYPRQANLLLFERQKGDTKIRLNKEKLTGHRKLYSKLEKPCKQASTQTIKSKQFVYLIFQLLTQQCSCVAGHCPIGSDE